MRDQAMTDLSTCLHLNEGLLLLSQARSFICMWVYYTQHRTFVTVTPISNHISKLYHFMTYLGDTLLCCVAALIPNERLLTKGLFLPPFDFYLYYTELNYTEHKEREAATVVKAAKSH